MEIFLKKITDKCGETYWVFYGLGGFAQPFFILPDVRMKLLLGQYLEQSKEVADSNG